MPGPEGRAETGPPVAFFGMLCPVGLVAGARSAALDLAVLDVDEFVQVCFSTLRAKVFPILFSPASFLFPLPVLRNSSASRFLLKKVPSGAQNRKWCVAP